MGRPKTISDADLIELINEYFYKVCNGNGSKLKLPAIAQYVVEHGYPDYQVTTLRRCKLARDHINALLANSDAAKVSLLVTYETLNVQAFLDSHRTRASLTQALTARDDYYCKIAETASELNSKYKNLSDENDALKFKLQELQEQIDCLKSDIQSANENCRTLQAEGKKLRKIINKYVYEGVSRIILEQEGIIPYTDSVVSSDAVDAFMISPATDIIDFASIQHQEIVEDKTVSKTCSESDVITQMLDPFK